MTSIALLLSLTSIYAVMSYTVAQRRRDQQAYCAEPSHGPGVGCINNMVASRVIRP